MTALRVVTTAAWLKPLGGVERCTLEDSIALSAAGLDVDVVYWIDGPQRREYESAGIKLIGPMNFGFSPWRAIHHLRAFADDGRRVRELGGDVLWLNRAEHIIWADIVAARARLPIVCHLHQVPNFRLTPLLYAPVAHFIAVSEFVRQRWIDAGIAPHRISTVGNAIPIEKFPFGAAREREAARAMLDLPPEIPIVLYYGLISPGKGVTTLLEAWQQVTRASRDALLILLGWPQPERDPRIRAVLSRGDPERVRWFSSRSDVVPFLHAADLVVMPSWVEEAFGRVVIEGLGTGRPVIASDVGGVPEILTGKLARLLVPPRDSDALANRICELLHWRRDDPEWADIGREHVTSHYEAADRTPKLVEALRRHSRRQRTSTQR